MKGYKLIKEHNKHFEMQHPDGSSFQVAKSGLSKAHQEKVRKLYDGTQPGDLTQDQEQPAPTGFPIESVPDPQAPQTFQVPLESSWNPNMQPLAPSKRGAFPGAKDMESAPKDFVSADPNTQQIDKTESSIPGPGQNFNTGAPKGAGKADLASYTPDSMDAFTKLADQNKQLTNEASKGIQGAAQSYAAAATQQQKAATDYQRAMEDQQKKWADQRQAIDKENQAMQSDIAAQKIDPHRVWANAGTGNKILAGIGVLLSGIGSGLTGQPNMAMQVLNKTIDDDIAAQKAELGKKENLLSQNYRKYGDLNAAVTATSMQLNGVLQAQLAATAGKMQNAQAQANFTMADTQLKQQQNAQANQLATQKAFNQSSGGAAPGGLDTTRLQQGISLGLIPKKEATEEYGKYRLMTQEQQTVKEAFAKIADLQKASSRLGSPLQSSRELDKIIDPLADKLARDTSGRVNETSLPIFKKIFQGFADNPQTAQTGLDTAMSLITDKYSFPTLELAGAYHPPIKEPEHMKLKPIGPATLTNYRRP